LRLPNLESQVPVFISTRNRVAQIYPWALGSLSVASYDSQGYGGVILSCLHKGYRFPNVSNENTASRCSWQKKITNQVDYLKYAT
jgi:hypothetical protein